MLLQFIMKHRFGKLGKSLRDRTHMGRIDRRPRRPASLHRHLCGAGLQSFITRRQASRLTQWSPYPEIRRTSRQESTT